MLPIDNRGIRYPSSTLGPGHHSNIAAARHSTVAGDTALLHPIGLKVQALALFLSRRLATLWVEVELARVF